MLFMALAGIVFVIHEDKKKKNVRCKIKLQKVVNTLDM